MKVRKTEEKRGPKKGDGERERRVKDDNGSG